MAPQENSISRILYTPDVYINEFGGGNGHVRNFELMMRETAHPVGRVCHAIINKSTAYLEELYQLSYANIIITQPGSGMLHNVFGLDTKVILAAPKYMEQAINATLFVKLYPADQVISQFHESEEINAKRLEAFLKE